MKELNYYLEVVNGIFERVSFLAEPRELYEPIEYTLRLGGKRLRPALLLMANAMFGGDDESVRHAAIGIELFHNFTLLHDDLMDRSPLRRGQPTVYTKWDANTAVISGDTMYALAWRHMLMTECGTPRPLLSRFAETAIGVCEGQQRDMNFERLGLAGVSEADYMEMIRQKTAVLLAGALVIGGMAAGAPEADLASLEAFGTHMGLAFQMQDDLLDAYGDEAVLGKRTCQDIRDNKITLLPLTALRLCDGAVRAELLDLFGSKEGADEEAKVRRVLEIYAGAGVRPAVEAAIDRSFDAARAALGAVGVEPGRKEPLHQLLRSLDKRKK